MAEVIKLTHEVIAMDAPAAYEEIVDFIARGIDPRDLVGFHPSQKTKERVADLLRREKSDGLSQDEEAELDQYLALEHLMRLAKARARVRLAHE
jgi:hypothetical protein